MTDQDTGDRVEQERSNDLIHTDEVFQQGRYQSPQAAKERRANQGDHRVNARRQG